MKKYTLLFLISFLALLVASYGNCESNPGEQNTELKVGDKVPNVLINNLINYSSPTARINDFKGKLLILDFWETWCKGCLESMPDIVVLRDKFGHSTQFINVTTQSQDVVTKFLILNKAVRNLRLTIAYGKNSLSTLFPHKLVPHIVWISPDGVYMGATSQVDLDAGNILNILTFGKTNFSEPKEDNLSFDANKPLFENGNGGKPEPLFKSLLTAYQPGLQSIDGFQEMSDNKRFYAVNSDLYSLFCYALGIQPYIYLNSRIIYKDSIAKKIFRYTKGSLKPVTLFCYELNYPKNYDGKVEDLVLNELVNWTGIRAYLNDEQINCLVLYRTRELHISSTDSINQNNLQSGTGVTKYIKGQYLQKLIDYLNDRENAPPFFNETGYDGKVDMVLNSDLSDLASLNKALETYGLVIREEKRNVSVMVVSSTSNFLTNKSTH